MQILLNNAYLAAILGVVFCLMGLSSLKTAFRSALLGGGAIVFCVVITLFVFPPKQSWLVIGAMGSAAMIGGLIARKVPMTALPQLMAAFHSLVGLAAVLLGFASFMALVQESVSWLRLLEISVGVFVGALTFSGSVLAFAKLQGLLNAPVWGMGSRSALIICSLLSTACLAWFCQSGDMSALLTLSVLGLLLGLALVSPIGGADMPVVVSMLNSYSGWAAVGIGFSLESFLLISIGSVVGASGAILSYVMCKGMNRPFLQVIFGGGPPQKKAASNEAKPFKKCSPEDSCFFLENAESVIIVPGYGMAVARAQHILKEVADLLVSQGKKVRFAVHPVAGRMPGHMNVLLAEADIPPELVQELEDINADFSETDVVLVIGANDITNPSARKDKESPLYGMPILDVDKAKTVLFIKRSLGVGYAAVENPLFYEDKTYMVLGDGKKVMESISRALAA